MKRTLIEWWCIGAVVSVIIVVDGQGDVVHDGNASHVSNITTDSHITDSYLTTTVYDHIDVSGESTEFTPAEITRGQGWEQDTDKGLYTYARNTNDNSSYVNETFTSTTHYSQEMNDFLGEGRAVVEDFFERYSNNRTQEVDVIFILDRSGSVPRKGWYSMLNFIKDLLEHFTVDADNTRVAIITFSTKANMDINDLKPGRMTDRENKCTLMRRIEDYIEKKVPYGYTATYDALDLAYNALLTSRPTAKKAIFVLTDGKSNIGPPPVKIAFDIISLQWDQKWDGEKHGPQVEIYALGVENANKPELISMATDLPHHVFLIPNFQKFEQLARSLHGDQQDETWIPANGDYCGISCSSAHAHCMCGTRIGQYRCICQKGYHFIKDKCQECPIGTYKESLSPSNCQLCPINQTTLMKGATSRSQCQLRQEFLVCSDLPDIENASKFYVAGTHMDEVMNTQIPCNGVTAGNSCHYQCHLGHRLTGVPIMICNQSASWQGSLPTCEDCHDIEDLYGALEGGSLHYSNGTTYGSEALVSCDKGHHPTGATLWKCDKHGRWTRPDNFKCLEVWCKPVMEKPFMTVLPPDCDSVNQPLGTNCSVTCSEGFTLSGHELMTCDFTTRSTWLPYDQPYCIDNLPPEIQCPDDIEVIVPRFGANFTVIHYLAQEPKLLRDNSGHAHYYIQGAPQNNRFHVGVHVLVYIAEDKEGNTRSCRRIVKVKGQQVAMRYCPSKIKLEVTSIDGTRRVEWTDPVFVDFNNRVMEHACNTDYTRPFSRGLHNIICYPTQYPSLICNFTVEITDPECAVPHQDRPPLHGSLTCGQFGHHFPKSCRVACKSGYVLNRLTRPDHTFNCGWDGTWDISTPWPECSRSRRPSKAHASGKFYLTFSGDCETSKEAITDGFLRSMKVILQEEYGLCTAETDCDVTGTEVFCRATGSRRKRSAIAQSRNIRRQRIKRSETAENITVSERNTSTSYNTSEGYEHNNNTQDHDPLVLVHISDDNNDDGIEMNDSDNGITMIGDVEDSNHTKLDSPNDTTVNGRTVQHIEISFNLEGLLVKENENETVTEEEQIILEENLNAVLDELYAKIESEDFHIAVDGHNLTGREVDVTRWASFEANCSTSEVIVLDEFYMLYPSCVTCPVGTYRLVVDGRENCELCPAGFYQDREGQHDCMECPPGTNTSYTGARNQSECTQFCDLGHFSPSGVEPCLPCPVGSYQGRQRASRCEACPDNTSTSSPGAVNRTQCLDMCQPGYFGSEGGLLVCELCPIGSYQDQWGASQCNACPQDRMTLNPGAILEDECIDINQCEIHGNICENNSTCHWQEGGVVCLCPLGYTGPTCQTNIDDCDMVICGHGGFCQDGINDFTCVCDPRYTGTYCEYELDECGSSPCIHGVCEDVLGDYICHCHLGYNGSNCDVDIDSCQLNPCVHGNCSDNVEGFQCTCNMGYTGDRCDVLIDHCSSSPCVRGLCHNTNGNFTCTCPSLWTGAFCEHHVDKCDNDVCQNGGSCYAQEDTYRCKCPPNYSGYHCELEVKSTFDLVFKEGDVGDYVLLRHAIWEDVSQISVCLWLRTDDSRNYGTILSYAADNNWLYSDNTNVFTLYDYGLLKIFVNGKLIETDVVLNNGMWHHLCVTWEGLHGNWNLYVNATLVSQGVALGSGSYIVGGGVLVIGQEQDSLGNAFNARESFVGEMSQLNIYSTELDANEVRTRYGDSGCNHESYGDVLSWTDVLSGIHGNVYVRNQSHCLDPNECLFHPCPDKHSCLDQLGTYQCVPCREGWTGEDCSLSLHVCDTNPCQHGATCLPMDDLHGKGEYQCACHPGYTGWNCQYKLETCSHHTCPDGSTCQEGTNGGYRCICPDGQTDPPCDMDDNTCLNSICQNGGTCSVVNATTNCKCRTGFSGDVCEIFPQSCDPDPCLNGGLCYIMNDNLLCACPPYWKGSFCQIQFHPTCDRSPCLNGGHCVTNVTLTEGYHCECPHQSVAPSWRNEAVATVNSSADPREVPDAGVRYGHNCEMLTACDSAPCQNRGTCVNLELYDYTCACTAGFTGYNCEENITDPQDIKAETTFSPRTTAEKSKASTSQPYNTVSPTPVPDHCANVECQHGGVCHTNQEGFMCRCKTDYRGTYCADLRKRATRMYNARVTLLLPSEIDMKYNSQFRTTFRNQIHNIYLGTIQNSTIRVVIKDIREGSVVVEFGLQHLVYLDSAAATLDEGDMRTIMYDQLKQGKLGKFAASLENFSFVSADKSGGSVSEDDDEFWMYIVVGILVFLILVASVAVFVLVRRRPSKAPSKLNNVPDVVRNRIQNPMFDPNEHLTPATDCRGMVEDNIYAEPGDYLQYYASSAGSDIMDDVSLGHRFPSKRGRDVNKDWDIVKGDATGNNVWLPEKGFAGYTVTADRESEYLEPNKGGKEAPGEDRCSTFYAIQEGEMKPSLPPEVYYFTPLTDDEAQGAAPEVEMCEKPCNKQVNQNTYDTDKDHQPLLSEKMQMVKNLTDEGGSDNSGFSEDEYLKATASFKRYSNVPTTLAPTVPSPVATNSRVAAMTTITPVGRRSPIPTPRQSLAVPAPQTGHNPEQQKQYMDMSKHPRNSSYDPTKRKLPPLPNEKVTRF